jgi:alkanesulfonate monooxygenase SsuD/methylene tetrahydromethanopterin reductase-like flavin-dependent oxidoreductase (luciferase family)
VRHGVVILQDLPWAQARARWTAAEEAGFDSAWTYDHLSWRTLNDGPWYGAVPLLAAVALATTRVRIGTLVANPNFRHPVPFAKELMTLDDLSGGRFDLGIGAGASSADATVLGEPAWPRAERTARFLEFVELLDLLLRQPVTSWQGTYYAADDARQIPGCVQQPRLPFTVAGTGPRALGLAARLGTTWVTNGPLTRPRETTPAQWYAAVRQQQDGLDGACAAVDRDVDSVDRMVLVPHDLDWAQSSPDAWDDFAGRIEEAGFDAVVVHWPRPEDPLLPGPVPAAFDHLVQRLRPVGRG